MGEQSDDTVTPDTIEVLEKLRRRERQLRESQQIAHVGSWEWDIVSDRIEWSDELYRIWRLESSAPFS